MGKLTVELYGVVLGHLIYSDVDTLDFDFKTAATALSSFSLQSHVMSLAVPLEYDSEKSRIQNRRNYFHGIIPEGKARLNLARLSGVSPEDTIGLLKARGLDLAGALMIYDEESGRPNPDATPRPVDDQQIKQMLINDEEFPLGNVRETGRTSLAGFQDKIVLARQEEHWFLAENGIPSSHILKPYTEKWPSLIYDEAWSLALAREIGLVSYDSYLYEFDGLDTLVIERFDRDPTVPGCRIHQEDFAQAFGIPDEKKYEELGEAWNLERVVNALYYNASAEDIVLFARQILYALAIGNLDMHAKNFGLIHLPDESIHLTPAYDIPPLMHHGLGESLAFRVDGTIQYSKITTDRIVKEFMRWEVEPFKSEDATKSFILEQLESIAIAARTIQPHKKAYPKLIADIERNLKPLLWRSSRTGRGNT